LINKYFSELLSKVKKPKKAGY
jgi:ubiquitin carboxyl-terminal hydrolase 34